VYIGSVKDAAKRFSFDEAEQVLLSHDGSTRITVFDKVTVQIRVDFSKKHLPKIIYRCLEPKLHEPFPEVPNSAPSKPSSNGGTTESTSNNHVTPAKRKSDAVTPTQNKKHKNK